MVYDHSSPGIEGQKSSQGSKCGWCDPERGHFYCWIIISQSCLVEMLPTYLPTFSFTGHFPDDVSARSSLSSCSRREPSEINGGGLLWARRPSCHSASSVKVLKGTE